MSRIQERFCKQLLERNEWGYDPQQGRYVHGRWKVSFRFTHGEIRAYDESRSSLMSPLPVFYWALRGFLVDLCPSHPWKTVEEAKGIWQ